MFFIEIERGFGNCSFQFISHRAKGKRIGMVLMSVLCYECVSKRKFRKFTKIITMIITISMQDDDNIASDAIFHGTWKNPIVSPDSVSRENSSQNKSKVSKKNSSILKFVFI